MERDGQCKSLWQEVQLSFRANDEPLPENETDVLIVGGGITGLTTGLLLQKGGKQCVIAEARNIGFGTTGGTTAHMNTLMDSPYYEIKEKFGAENARSVAKIARQAIELIRRNIDEYTIECGFKELPGYILTQNDSQVQELAKIADSCKEAGIEIHYSQSVPTPIPFNNALFIEKQAQFHPLQYIIGLAKAFEEAGGEIMQNCRVTEVSGNSEMAEVVTDKGKIKTNFVVYATHIPPGVNILHFQCAPYRSYALAVKLSDENYPSGLVYDMDNPYHYYRTQEINGEKFLIAGGEDHKTGHEENTILRFTKLESYVRKYFQVSAITHRWSSQYFESADGLPYIGELPGNPQNILVATGFGGNGMIYGTASGMILSDLITSGESEYKDLFNPKRAKPIAGFEKVIRESSDVVGQFVGKRFSIPEINELADLAKGEAKVVKYEGASIALYKDENGKHHAVNPSCPHINCVVNWNNAEQSWDCPCHGSRFSFDGELLTGPSRKNLEPIELRESKPNISPT